MLGQTLVNYCAVGVAQRHRSRLGGKAFPDDLGESHTLFGGELEDFSYVRVTHGFENTTLITCALT